MHWHAEALWMLFDHAGIDPAPLTPYPRHGPTPEPPAPATIKPGTPEHDEILAMEARLKQRQANMRLWGTGIVVKRGER